MTARAWRHYWIAVVLLVAAIPLPAYVSRYERVPLLRPLSALSYRLGAWSGRDEYISKRVRRVLGADDLLLREYARPQGLPVGLYVSYFASQQQGEGTHSPRNCLPGAGWEPLWARRVSYPLADQRGTINEVLFEKDGRRQLVFYWFRERGRILASEYSVKLYLMWDAMTRRRTDGALIRVSTPMIDESGEAAARQRCLDFMTAALPQLRTFFRDS